MSRPYASLAGQLEHVQGWGGGSDGWSSRELMIVCGCDCSTSREYT